MFHLNNSLLPNICQQFVFVPFLFQCDNEQKQLNKDK